jgi:L-asparagine transporter-like permease
MSDTFLTLFSLVVALVVIAYLIRIRRRKSKDPGSDSTWKTKWMHWSNIAVLSAILLLVLGFFMLRSVLILWVSISVLIVSLLVGYFLKNTK